MKNFSWKKIVPHVIAIVVFLVVALIYCRPAMEGQVLQQTDVIHWRGMAQDAISYKEQHGHLPLWNTHLFSGMPNYQVDQESTSYLPDFTSWISLGLPKPISFFFVACVSFYILSLAFGLDVIIAILASLAFAYATYDPVIIIAGHESKMNALAYAPGLFAGIYMIYKKKYLLGLVITMIFSTLEITAGHYQITYYMFLIVGIMTLYYIYVWVKNKEFKHLVLALVLAGFGTAVGLGNIAKSLMTTAEYAKYTMRGGKTVTTTENGKSETTKTSGLDLDYAFSYSLGKGEGLVLMMPNAYGGSSIETFDEDSHLASALSDLGANPQIASQVPKYWGGINPSTAGPPYSGALICFLAVIGLAVLNKESDKWWMFASIIFGLILSFGSYLPGINGLLFKVLPMYNKFRAPSMALVIPQFVLPLMAGVTLQKIFYAVGEQEYLNKNFKKILYAAGGLFAIALLVYVFNDFTSPMDEQLKSAFGGADKASPLINGIIKDRKGMFASGLGHALLFGLIALGGIFLYVRKIAKPAVIIAVFLVINMIDLLRIDSKYLNSENFVENSDLQSQAFSATPAEQQVLLDKSPHYRVLNLVGGNPFNDAVTSYYFRSIGGYHPAKLRIYQDVIENQFSKPSGGLNMAVLNMLDTKYILTQDQQAAANPQQQGGQGVVQQNPEALGAAWFVKNIQYVNSSADALNALGTFDPKTTAIIENSNKANAASPNYDSTATIQLDKYDNDTIRYTTNAKSNQFAVMSEVYYPAGWNAYIDGKETNYVSANYVLRGINVPAGKHTVEFKFEPKSAIVGQKVIYASNAIFYIVLVLSIVGLVKKRKSEVA
ncbi:YfhO family protein [Rhizosphaericola mali]|uniref:YfhO family protein n=1 Tax=Rhizosphaericola mali TaxID=2545455 RepID=A0A5P2FVG5_9BACT|nr:YfhO family protein [Rhizosphaericola mali]QES87486.1 YfhO family protein [Rhizosphaericola mali]